MRGIMTAVAVLAAVALAPAAEAAEREVALELGSFGAPDEDFDLFSHGDALPTRGLRVGWPVHERVAVIAGWHHGARGLRVYPLGDEYDYEYDDDYSADNNAFVAAFYGDQFTLGAKADWALVRWLLPYATVQAVGYRGLVRLDDDLQHDDNPNQVQRSAFAPGAMATAGLDVRVPFGETFAAATYLELGYGYVLPLDFADLGEIDMRGFVLRWGVGARF